jgi:hypothetical protein
MKLLEMLGKSKVKEYDNELNDCFTMDTDDEGAFTSSTTLMNGRRESGELKGFF